MALSLVDVGTTANDGTGDPLRTAFQTVNTALTAVNNAVVVGTGTTTFKDDSGTYGVTVASNGDVTFTNAGGSTAFTFDASALSNAGAIGLGTPTPVRMLHLYGAEPSILQENSAAAANYKRWRTYPSAVGWVLDAVSDDFLSTSPAYTVIRTGVSVTQHNWYIAGALATRVDATGFSIGAISPSAALDINSDKIRLRTAKTPASAGAAGNTGDICWDADYIYVCTATNTWKRTAIATW